MPESLTLDPLMRVAVPRPAWLHKLPTESWRVNHRSTGIVQQKLPSMPVWDGARKLSGTVRTVVIHSRASPDGRPKQPHSFAD